MKIRALKYIKKLSADIQHKDVGQTKIRSNSNESVDANASLNFFKVSRDDTVKRYQNREIVIETPG